MSNVQYKKKYIYNRTYSFALLLRKFISYNFFTPNITLCLAYRVLYVYLFDESQFATLNMIIFHLYPSN